MRHRLAAALALSLAGCLASHTGDGDSSTRREDAGVPLDGALRDGQSPDGDAGELSDAGFEPPLCVLPTDECFCFYERRRDTAGRCIAPFHEVEPCDIGSGCIAPGWLCNDMRRDRTDDFTWGICTTLGVCAWQRSRESQARCFYEDGTFYDTGFLASDSCDGSESGVLCGPGCGGCSAGRTCVGVSERSGLGLCVRGNASESSDRCGELHPDCEGGRRCVGFVLPDGVSTALPERVWHACVSEDRCNSLAARYPTRFVCD